MEINGYELESIAHMAAGGPLWHTHTPSGAPALLTLRSARCGEEAEQRWRAWAGIDDPRVVHLLDVARHADGRWALVMERVEGTTLEALLALGLPRDRRGRNGIAHGVREGLEVLHGHGIVHGDPSPANVVVRGDGTPVLVDLVDPPARVAGTPGWSSGGSAGEPGDLEAWAALCAALGVAAQGSPTGDVGAGSPAASGGRRSGKGVGGRAGSGAGNSGDGRDVGGARSGVRGGVGNSAGDGEGATGGTVGEVDASAAVDVLRRVATSEDTEVWEVPRRGRTGRVLAAAAVLAAVAALVPLSLTFLPGPAQGGGAPGAEASCPGEREAAGILADLVARRDAALVQGDRGALEEVTAGGTRRADRALLATLEATGTTVTALTSDVTDVEVLGCRGDVVQVAATVGQRAQRRCDARGACAVVPAVPAHRVRIDLVADPWRVTEVRAG